MDERRLATEREASEAAEEAAAKTDAAEAVATEASEEAPAMTEFA